MSLEIRCERKKKLSKHRDEVRDNYPQDIKFRENFALRNITFSFYNRFNLTHEDRGRFPNRMDYDPITAQIRGDIVDVGGRNELLLDSGVLLAEQFIYAAPKEFYYLTESPYYPKRAERAFLKNLGTSLGRYVFWQLVDNRDGGEKDSEITERENRQKTHTLFWRAYSDEDRANPNFGAQQSRKARERAVTKYCEPWLGNLGGLETQLCSILGRYCKQRIGEYGDGYMRNGTEQVDRIILPVGDGKIKEIYLSEPRAIGDVTVATPVIVYDEFSRSPSNIVRMFSGDKPTHLQKSLEEIYLVHGEGHEEENVKKLSRVFDGEVKDDHLRKIVSSHESYL